METITQTKICSKCKTEKELSFFSNAKTGKYGKRAYCKNCAKVLKTMWDNKNRDKISTQCKDWKKNNKQRQEQHNIKYQCSIKGIINKKNMRQRRRSLTKQGDVTNIQLLELQQNAKVCYWCKCLLKNVKVHIDHYVPLSKGGLHTLSNLVVSCSKCNLSKEAKLPNDFANSIGRLL